MTVAIGVAGLGSGSHDLRGPVGAAVVDDEDADDLRQVARARSSVTSLFATTPQIAEQLVERRLEPRLLVEGGQHDRHRPGAHGGSVYVARPYS